MSDGSWKHVTAKTAVDAAKRAELGDAARALLKPELAPKPFFDLLVQQNMVPDALAFLASALPKREAVWWACQCVRSVTPVPPPKEEAALAAAEKWSLNATDANRRSAHAAAEAATFATPAGTAALAAFLSEGSLAPAHIEKPIPPAEHLTAFVVNAVLTVAAVHTKPEKASEKRKKFLELGVAVAAGTNRWSDGPPARR